MQEHAVRDTFLKLLKLLLEIIETRVSEDPRARLCCCLWLAGDSCSTFGSGVVSGAKDLSRGKSIYERARAVSVPSESIKIVGRRL